MTDQETGIKHFCECCGDDAVGFDYGPMEWLCDKCYRKNDSFCMMAKNPTDAEVAKIKEQRHAKKITTRRPWAARADELHATEGPYADYSAWYEWFNAQDRDHDITGSLDSLQNAHLYSMFVKAYEGR